MNYISTRGGEAPCPSAYAIKQGIANDGGLFVPVSMPRLSGDDIQKLAAMDYRARAAFILSRFLTDYTYEELLLCANQAYGERFDTPAAAPLHALQNNCYCLELWHGPTCAFKDMALQIMPRLLPLALEKSGEKRTAVILVATSGDTGKAALEGFKDVPHTKIQVFFPSDGVSNMQKLQMITQEGENVGVCGIYGNFDNAQSGVKAIFSDEKYAQTLNENGYYLSSANSINWGRLVPQIVYYFSAYCDLLNHKAIALGDKIDFCVPTGNFGDILAGFYAKQMGLPVNKLVCASNSNNVLTDFIRDGVYDRNRQFYTTVSPSMDILISSNIERLVFNLTDGDAQKVSGYMASLSKDGRYELDDDVKAKLAEHFEAFWCTEEETKETIRRIYEEQHYLIDPHTAVAFHAAEAYAERSGSSAPMVVLSTASPYKFASAVCEALHCPVAENEADCILQLQQHSGVPAPASLTDVLTKTVRHKDTCAPADMQNTVSRFLGIHA